MDFDFAKLNSNAIQRLAQTEDSDGDAAFWELMRTDMEFLEDWLRLPVIAGEDADPKTIQTVHTPLWLCDQMVEGLLRTIKMCHRRASSCRMLVLNLEFAVSLINHGILPEQITLVTDNEKKAVLAKKMYNTIMIVNGDFLEMESRAMKKFDVSIGNPPYQADTENKGSGHTLWNKFVEQAFSLCQESGYICFVHPAGWRRPTGVFKDLGQKMRSKDMRYLEIHSIADGEKTFKVCTRYDWYVICNRPAQGKTIIKDENGGISDVDISKLICIPNGMFDKILGLLASKDGEDRVEIIKSESAYEGRKSWMSETQTAEFKYPCIYSLPQKGMQLRWSSVNNNGHFGIPKVIFSNGAAPQVIIDEVGQYGLTQWSFGISDSVKNLPKIKKVMESEEFIALCKYMRFTLDRYDVNFLSCLKRDFWKHFLPKSEGGYL